MSVIWAYNPKELGDVVRASLADRRRLAIRGKAPSTRWDVRSRRTPSWT